MNTNTDFLPVWQRRIRDRMRPRAERRKFDGKTSQEEFARAINRAWADLGHYDVNARVDDAGFITSDLVRGLPPSLAHRR